MTRKNTPEKFAKKVLSELAGIRADLDILLSGRVLEISRLTGVPPEQVQASVASQILEQQQQRFSKMIADCDMS